MMAIKLPARPKTQVRPKAQARPEASGKSSKPLARAPSLAEQTRIILEDKIVSLELEPGSMWSEGDLANLTGFGRTPVREALKRLESLHLVRIVQRHGVQITPINVEQQLLLLETRRELERLVAGRAARRRSESQSARCTEFARGLRDAGRRGDMVAFRQLYSEAQQLILEAAGNPFAAAAVSPLYALSKRFYVLHHRTAQDLRLACEYHAKTLLAVAARDESAARLAVDAVLDYVEGFTRSTLAAPT